MRLFFACYFPVTSLLTANYLPVMVLFCVQRLFFDQPSENKRFSADYRG
jgi:hypothetical protein